MSKKVILCVDDEQIILTSLRDQINRNFGRQYLCELAESADEALEIIEELNEDDIDILVIVSDWLMPEMKGDEFLLKVHQQFPQITKVLLSGQADEEAIERTRQQVNLHRYLPKPWDETTLIEVLKSGLGGNE
ncbi:MAG: response regulator [Symploca sp. SIO1B1]|nr:response regulator [Symploca sp. SIO2D2]NER21556.1 response regulator [Symploca sp. SIO1C2]NER48422.1 response regulator [Symploca sp. SIO1A3]NER95639.1 response regulator [Symploca sp. SIO1B1]